MGDSGRAASLSDTPALTHYPPRATLSVPLGSCQPKPFIMAASVPSERWTEKGGKQRSDFPLDLTKIIAERNKPEKVSSFFSLYPGSLLNASANTVFSPSFQYSSLFFSLQKYPSRAAKSQCFYDEFSPKIFWQLFPVYGGRNQSSLSLSFKPQEFFQRYNGHFSLLNNAKL